MIFGMQGFERPLLPSRDSQQWRDWKQDQYISIHININLFEITPAKLTTLRNLTNIDRRMVTHDSPGRLLLPRAWQPWNLPSSRWSDCYKRCQREKPFDNFLGVAAVHCGRNSARLKCLLLGWWIYNIYIYIIFQHRPSHNMTPPNQSCHKMFSASTFLLLAVCKAMKRNLKLSLNTWVWPQATWCLRGA